MDAFASWGSRALSFEIRLGRAFIINLKFIDNETAGMLLPELPLCLDV